MHVCVRLCVCRSTCAYSMEISNELVTERKSLYKHLHAKIHSNSKVDENSLVRFLKEFPRSENEWCLYIDISNEQNREEICQSAIDHCRKSVKVWAKIYQHIDKLSGQFSTTLFGDIVPSIGSNILGKPLIERVCGTFDGPVLAQPTGPMSTFSIHPEWAQICPEIIHFLHNSVNNPTTKHNPTILHCEWFFHCLIFWHNDVPQVWIGYANWLVNEDRLEDAVCLLEEACDVFLPYSARMKWMAGEFFKAVHHNELAEKLFHQCIAILMKSNIPIDLMILESVAIHYGVEEGTELLQQALLHEEHLSYIYILLFNLTKQEFYLEKCIAQFTNCSFTEVEARIFAFAVENLPNLPAYVEKILTRNHHLLVSLFGTENKSLMCKSTPPPKPVNSAPPKPTTQTTHHQQPHRALPGYTPGWMAADYAKKHNI